METKLYINGIEVIGMPSDLTAYGVGQWIDEWLTEHGFTWDDMRLT